MILSDHGSWLNDYLFDLQMEWETQGHRVVWAHETAAAESELAASDAEAKDPSDPSLRFCFCLSFGSIVSNKFRSRFGHTLVVHESDLPRGKGWSPLTWQILEGQNRIPVTLIEAAEQVDSGVIYAQKWLDFQGHELIDELRREQAQATHSLCRWFVDFYPESVSNRRAQEGEATFYPRRRPSDSCLDENESLSNQFDLLRVVDNRRYPAILAHRSFRYKIVVTKL